MRILAAIIISLILLGCGGVEPDFYTYHGMAVTVGDKNRPGPRTVEFWTDQTIFFWRLHYPQWLQCMNDSTKLVHAIFVDEDHVMSNGKKYGGLAHSDDLTIEISCCGTWKVRGVFIHELSHVYAGECGGVWSNNGSHAMFDEVNLKALTLY